tara:strand:- start:149 stop:283 length:135 start_codon:yes stop_codon:yes gene_type:complete
MEKLFSTNEEQRPPKTNKKYTHTLKIIFKFASAKDGFSLAHSSF